MCPRWLKMVLGTIRDMFRIMLTSAGPLIWGFGMEDLEAWHGKSSIFADFNVFMLFFLIKALENTPKL